MPATIGWRKREEDGLIVTWDLPNGAEEVPMLPASQWNAVKRVEERWGPLCREIGAKYLLPDGWLQAMIFRESGGNPRARNTERTADPTDDGIGLLQITNRGLKGNRTDEQLFDPLTNIEIAAKYVAYLAGRPDTRAKDGSADFAKVAAAFNAGGVRDSAKNRFGMVSTGDHVDHEVRTLNTWTYQRLEGEKFFAAQAFAKNFPATDLIEDHGPAGVDDAPDTPRNTG